MRALLLVVVVSSAACLRPTEFKCMNDTDCSASGAVCESTGYCSFADPNCVGGRRYGDFSGSAAGTCVGSIDIDAGVDARPDGPMGMGCPTNYMQFGLSAHRYRVIAATGTWPIQKAACPVDGANVYLAVPTDQQELSALVQAANAQRVWLGVDDQTTEGTYATTKGGTIADNDPMWDSANGEPNNTPFMGSGDGDCVLGVMSNAKIADENCTKTYPAICECEP
jgi:hypothetical protein